MLKKFALCDVSPLNTGNYKDEGSLIKTASGNVIIEPNSEKARRIEAEIQKHPTALFFRAKAIKADEPNSNGDYFSEAELKKSYKSFEGVPFFSNHDNQNVENARGKIIFAEWVPAEKAVYTIAYVDREAFPHICRGIEEDYVSGVSMGAISGGSKILMADFTEKNIEDVKAGDVVISHTGNSNKVKMVHNEFLGKQMYSFDLMTYHKSPLFTNDHPILTIDKEQMQEVRKIALNVAASNQYERRMGKTDETIGQDTWRSAKYDADFKQAQNVCVGDYFLIPSKFKLQEGHSEDKDFNYVVGAFLGDGYLKKDKKGEFEAVSFCLGLDDLELADKLTKILKKYTNAEVCSTICPERNGLYLNFYDRKLAKKFYDLTGTGSKDKRIKFDIKHIEDAVALINGYLDTDGCVVKNKDDNESKSDNKFGGTQISSANIGLLEDVQSLLIALGCISRISKMDRVPGKNSIVKINTTEYTLSIGNNASSLFTESIKLANYGIRNAEIKAGKSFITTIDNRNYMVCPVKTIEMIEYNEPVYDLTVECDESYVADGVAIHNCSVEYSICNICENRAEKVDDYCFVPNTPILMSDLSLKNIQDISVGDNVIDAFGNSTRVIQCFVRNVDEDLISFYTKATDGEMICTKNHPFLALRRNKFLYIPAEFLEDKETVFTPISKMDFGDSIFLKFKEWGFEDTEENRLAISKLIGYFVAEGCLYHNAEHKNIGIGITLHSDEVIFRDEIVAISKAIFNKDPEIVDRMNYNHKAVDIRIYHPLLVKIIEASCLGLAKHKILNKDIVALPIKYIKCILAGYIDGDGYSDDYGRIIITTASKNLASQVFHLLIRMGVAPSIYSYDQNGGPSNREKLSKIFKIQIASKQLEPIKDCGIKCIRSYEISLDKSDKTKLINCFNKDGMLKYSIFNTEEVRYSGPVYNIETESNSYVANNASVHNCSHIKNRKGRKFSGRAKNVRTGETKDFNNHPVFEYNYGIKFIELSAVVDPACPSCRIDGVIENDAYLQRKVASIQNSMYMLKTAAMEKKAGAEEIEQLNQCLQTLEELSIKLIQNRKQVEVEFASDLVGILSNLQEFSDELVAAGYGQVQTVPGTGMPGASPGAAPLPPMQTQNMPSPAEAMPAASEQPMLTPAPVGNVSGVPGKSTVAPPRLPITAPAKPRASGVGSLQKISNLIGDINKKLNNLSELAQIKDTEEDDMAKRRTRMEATKQNKMASEKLSTLWQEKQKFSEYIKKVPNMELEGSKLSVKQNEDSVIIVAEKINDPSDYHVWTFDVLTDNERELIKQDPSKASRYFITAFNKINITHKAKGVNKMEKGKIIVEARRDIPETITEDQLAKKDVELHSRTGEEQDSITEEQLAKYKGIHAREEERDVITEEQLNKMAPKLHPRENKDRETITQDQLEKDRSGASPRENNERNVITQEQLEEGGNKTGTEKDTITEDQLNKANSPWDRSANRNPAMFKSASDHVDAVVNVLADTSIATGCTPDEIRKIVAGLVGSTSARLNLGNSILESSTNSEAIDYKQRLAFWSKKNIKVANIGSQDISDVIVHGLRAVASDKTIDPELVISALDVISDGDDGIKAIASKIDEKLVKNDQPVVVSKKDQIRDALKKTVANSNDEKKANDKEREKINASVENFGKNDRKAEREQWNKALSAGVTSPDTIIETSMTEIGLEDKKSTEENVKVLEANRSVIKTFAKAALLARNIKMASITNVTIDGNTIQIAVETKEGDEGVEIPLAGAEEANVGDTAPEGDLSGEMSALPPLPSESAPASMPAPAAAMPATPPTMASSKKMVKTAQTPAGGGIPNAPGGVAGGGGSPEQGLATPPPAGGPGAQSLTMDAPADEAILEDEIPTAGEKQPPYAICPECGSSDVDIKKEDDGGIEGDCKSCGAKYEALIKKNVEFKIIKPTVSVGEKGIEQPEAPEVPALPVAAQTKLDKDSLKRLSSNKEKFGHVCPACGMTNCKASTDKEGHAEYTCPACQTRVAKDTMVDVNSPDSVYLRVKWDVYPDGKSCKECKESSSKLVSMIKVANRIKTAQANVGEFPMANCIERVARKYGGNSTASYGPCKGKPLADCVCNQLQSLGLRTNRHLERLASVYTQPDPMDECIKDQKGKGLSIKQAETICNCLKKKFANKTDANPFLMAFAEDIKSGTIKDMTMGDLDAINDYFVSEMNKTAQVVEEVDVMDEDIGSPLPELDKVEADVPVAKESPVAEETVVVELSEGAAQELSDAVSDAIEDASASKVADEVSVETDIPEAGMSEELNTETEKGSALAMQTHKLRRVGEDVVKIAAKPTVIKDFEGNVEAGVPRGKATMGNEGPKNIDVALNKPNIPRGKATMGQEGPSNIDVKMDLPDVPVDSSYMGVNEKSNQASMPAINNEIRGRVVASDKNVTKEAKKMKEVDTVVKDVEAGVPTGKATMGNEGADNIDVPLNKPNVPRGKATMGNESADNIDVKMDSPDVPVGSGAMGHEKEVQKDMPGINDEYLTRVQADAKKEKQLERIAIARWKKATSAASKLLALGHISEAAFDDVVEALSQFEIDKIDAKASAMFSSRNVKTASVDKPIVEASGLGTPAIVLESKVQKEEKLADKISGLFTIGNREFTKSLENEGLR